MSPLKHYSSTVARKFFTGLAGLLLVAFLCVHLGGNLTMFVGPGLFNSYTHHLESLGPLLYVAEIGLLALFVIHAVLAIMVQWEKRKARPEGYAKSASKGGPSRYTISSRTMIITGIVIAVYLPIHVWMFKFNSGQPSPMMTLHDGKEVRDLYTIVLLAFKNPAMAWVYVVLMALLGFHLRHGFWSAFQSLGALSPRLLPVFYVLGVVVAILLAGGFIVLPLYMLYGVPAPGM
jgi:succinate dehydrogenase / fumarate reductase cytochrome b subunit